ncbi:MAG: hypothetical protein K940chlam9_01795, partial [Chlamydiae bacterium]|nr:hypothetical protein [Chlamydiota bacterium]
AFKRSSGDQTLFQFEVPKHFLAFQADGSSHPLNTKIQFSKEISPKDKTRFKYLGTITDGSGRERSFVSPMHRWNGSVFWRMKTGHWPIRGSIPYRIQPRTWTPYHIPIVKEKLPNGNILVYGYTQWKEEKKNYPFPRLLSSITAYNADKTKKLGSIQLQYPRAKHKEVAKIRIIGSDQRTALIQHTEKTPIQITSAKKPGSPRNTYTHQDKRLSAVSKANGYTLKTEYNKEGKVSAQYAPVGPNGKMCPIGRYGYNTYMTQVVDAEGNKVDYHFDPIHKRLHTIAYLRDHQVYKQEHFERDDKTGNILRKTVADGDNTPLQITEYTYDKNQNPIEEKVGDGQEWRKITRTFSADGFNLTLTETDRPGKLICYTYIPETNLLASELTYEQDTICKRIFHTYDDCAICIESITDDGISDDPQDLEGITYRKITRITPKYSTPCFGLPELIEEKTIDPNGHELLLQKTVYTYTPFGKVLQEDHYDAENSHRYTICNTYDKEERLTSTTDPLGAVTTFTYDANNNLTSITGPRPEQHREIAYDKANRPIRTTDSGILTTHKTYDKLGRVFEEIDPCGHATRYEYDVLSRVTKISHPDGAIERKEYDVLGNVTKETDPKGFETHKTYNTFGQALSIHCPDGSQEQYTYNPTGTIETFTDKNGATTHYTYDLFDHPIQIDTYSSSGELLKTTSATYSPFHKLSETDAVGNTTHYTYDFSGRLISEKMNEREVTYEYDSLGRQYKTTEGDSVSLEFFNNRGEVVEKRIEDTQGNTLFQEQYTYDPAGSQTSVITCMGTTHTTYNNIGKPLEKLDPQGSPITYSYTYLGGYQETITDPIGVSTYKLYDLRNRLTELSIYSPQGELLQKREKHYDLAENQTHAIEHVYEDGTFRETIIHETTFGPLGRCERLLEAGEKETLYFYDATGRLSTTQKPDGTELHREYDPLGRLSLYYGPDFSYTYTYDALDRVIEVENTTRTYDTYGNLIEETLRSGLTLKSTYDSYGKRKTLTLPNNRTVSYTHQGPHLKTVTFNQHTHTYTKRNLAGKLTQIDTSLGQITNTYDPALRLQTTNAPHLSATYTYDTRGNLTTYTFSDPIGQETRHYAYDDLSQLTSENQDTYTYDSHYNRTRKNTQEYTLNPLFQVLSDGESTYTYDSNGNLLSDGKHTYTYDSLDRLISVDDTTYTYDPFNRRIYKDKTPFLWDEKNEIGSPQDLRILGEGLGAEIGAAVYLELKKTPYIPLFDHQGSLRLLLHKKKKPETYRYNAFGEELTSSVTSPWRFASKRLDPETGYLYFGRRYYSPT